VHLIYGGIILLDSEYGNEWHQEKGQVHIVKKAPHL
jgi:hypothetical protein